MSLLNKYSTPAERQRGCRFAERFEGPTELARNGGTTGGSVTWQSNGIRLNTSSSYVAYTIPNGNLPTHNLVSWGGVLEFTPEWLPDDSLSHYLVNIGGALVNSVYHQNTNSLIVRFNTTLVLTVTYATYAPYWRSGQRNILSWSFVNGANYLYLNGTLIGSSATASAAAPLSTPVLVGSSSSLGGIMTIHNLKMFTPPSTTQALTAKDCEVLSAGTTYTYWKNATCIMDGMAANYDIANYRHLDISGNANHVLLGNGAGTGTPTKLSAQGYSFNGSSHYMTVPLAAWPGSAGTILLDVNATTSGTLRLFGTDHSSGGNYEVFTSVSAPNNRVIMGTGSGQVACSLGLDRRYSKIIICTTWLTSGGLRGYTDALWAATTAIGATTPQTPDTAWWLMRYDSSYCSGALRSFCAFNKELSYLQVIDATLAMQNWRNKV